MRTVWKMAVEANAVQGDTCNNTFLVPPESKPLCVKIQEGHPFIWIEVEDDKPLTEKITIACVGTGFGQVPENGRYLGTILQQKFVWHFYVLENQT